jgi:hypothetical protein
LEESSLNMGWFSILAQPVSTKAAQGWTRGFLDTINLGRIMISESYPPSADCDLASLIQWMVRGDGMIWEVP